MFCQLAFPITYGLFYSSRDIERSVLMSIGMWSCVSAHSSTGPHLYVLSCMYPVANVRSITLLCCPLLHVGYPCGVRRYSLALAVSWSRSSACASMATCIPPQAGWCVLKSLKRIISLFVLWRICSMSCRIFMCGPRDCGLYILIMLIVLSLVLSLRTAILSPCCVLLHYSYLFLLLELL
jgi:hypothetical protein